MKNLYNTLMSMEVPALEYTRRNDEDYARQIGVASWLKECGTVTLDFGRMTGKTTAALMFLKMNPDAVLIVCNFAFKRHLCRVNPDVADRIMVYTELFAIMTNHRSLPHLLKHTPDHMRGRLADTRKITHIILDEPRFIPKTCYGEDFLQFIYDHAYHIGVRKIIRLGMV